MFGTWRWTEENERRLLSISSISGLSASHPSAPKRNRNSPSDLLSNSVDRKTEQVLGGIALSSQPDILLSHLFLPPEFPGSISAWYFAFSSLSSSWVSRFDLSLIFCFLMREFNLEDTQFEMRVAAPTAVTGVTTLERIWQELPTEESDLDFGLFF